MEVGLFIGSFIHIIQGYVLECQNQSKRKIGYKVPMGNKGSTWYSRSMGLLGTFSYYFLFFTGRISGSLPGLPVSGPEMILRQWKNVHNVFALMQDTFQELWVVIVYVIGCFSLFWHLLHGFQSAFRTMGFQQ